MVSLDELAAFDFLIWLRTGLAASAPLHCNQSTISRQVRRVGETFHVALQRIDHEWITSGNTTLLQLEREVHQLKRLIEARGLRLEADNWPGCSLAMPIPVGWQPGTLDRIGLEAPLQLLRHRVIDAWLTCNKDELPAGPDSEWALFSICSMPWQLMVNRNHPLAQEKGLTRSDLDGFPAPSITNNKVPLLEQALRSTGLNHNCIDPCHQYIEDDWCGRTKDQQSLCYGIELVRLLDSELTNLDFNLEVIAEIALVVRQDIADHPPIHQLVATLRQRATELQTLLPTLELS